MNVHALRRALEAAENLENALLEITHLPELEKMDNRAHWIRKSLERALGEVERSLVEEMKKAGKSRIVHIVESEGSVRGIWTGHWDQPFDTQRIGGAR